MSMRVEKGGLWVRRTRAVERRATESEADRATRELAWKLSAPHGKLVDRNYKNMSSGETRPARTLARRVREAARNRVPLPHVIEAGHDWWTEFAIACYREVQAEQFTPTAPTARRRAA